MKADLLISKENMQIPAQVSKFFTPLAFIIQWNGPASRTRRNEAMSQSLKRTLQGASFSLAFL